MLGRVIVLNPNSTERISREIDRAVQTLASDLGVEVRVVTSRGGPPAVESDDDVAASIGPMIETAREHPADAYVVACFSDPGVDELRAAVEAPVLGIGEASVLAAMARARRVGIISAVEDAVPRHFRYWDRIGLASRVIGDIATGRGVLDLEGEDAYQDVLKAGHELSDVGAEVVVLGCTGMTQLRSRLQRDLGLSVIEPCRAAVTFAAAALRDSGG